MLEVEFVLADVDLDWDRARDTTHSWLHKDGLFSAFPLPNSQQWRLFADFRSVPGCYDEWILPERERLRQTFLEVLERLIGVLEQERDAPAAIRAAQRLLRHDPLHEVTYRHLMRLYAGEGDRAAALRVYHTCATVLERELGTGPSRATRQMYEHLLQAETPAGSFVTSLPPLAAETPLIGRRHEWATLLAAWHRATTGQPHLIVLSGEAGIGKTRLAEELVTWLGRQGIPTATAHCYPAEGELAYAPVAMWLCQDALRKTLGRLPDIWLAEVGRLVPDLLIARPDLPQRGPLRESWQRQRLFEALARAILLAPQPLLLFLDDLQWGDRETLEWLHYFFRFDQQARILLLGTLRSEVIMAEHPVETLFTALRRDGRVTEIALTALDVVETASLAEHVAQPSMAAICGSFGRQVNWLLGVVLTLAWCCLSLAYLVVFAGPSGPGPLIQIPCVVIALIGIVIALLASPAIRHPMPTQ